MGILLSYPTSAIRADSEVTKQTLALSSDFMPAQPISSERGGVAFIGAGNYATSTLISAFKEAGAQLVSIASRGGVSGVHSAKKYGFKETTTDVQKLLIDPDINALVIATRHNTHSHFALKGLAAGKSVFVEKPLCLSLDELSSIESECERLAHKGLTPFLMVGFNRRFAPQIKKIKELLLGVGGTKSFVMTVNAGPIPADHWTQDREVGGGRVIGEVCHFIDLLRFLSGSSIIQWQSIYMNSQIKDSLCIQLKFADGSIGSINYLANGNKSFPKEKLEVFVGGRILQLDNFRRLTGYGWTGFKRMNLWRQDKGQNACAKAFIDAHLHGGLPPIPLDELLEVSRVAIEISEAQD